jgi:hypothetical protein
MPKYKIQASSLTATYSAGTFTADSSNEACEMAKKDYMNSPLGRALKDVVLSDSMRSMMKIMRINSIAKNSEIK